MKLLRELLPDYKNTREHIENNGIIYDILPLPEMNISIITWASTKMLQKGWHRQVFIWLPLGLVIGLLAAMFVLRICAVSSHRIIGCRMLSKIVIFACTISRLSP